MIYIFMFQILVNIIFLNLRKKGIELLISHIKFKNSQIVILLKIWAIVNWISPFHSFVMFSLNTSRA